MDAKRIYDTARYEINVSISDLEDKIIATHNAEYIYKFAKDIISANVEKLADGIIATKDVRYICEFAKSVPCAPINKLAKAIIEIGDPEYIYKFAFIEGAPIEVLAYSLIILNDIKHITLFAKYIKNIDEEIMDKLAEAVINIGKLDSIYIFARDVENAPIEKLVNVILKSNNPEYIYYTIANVPNAPIDKLIMKLKEINNKDWLIALLSLKSLRAISNYIDNEEDINAPYLAYLKYFLSTIDKKHFSVSNNAYNFKELPWEIKSIFRNELPYKGGFLVKDIDDYVEEILTKISAKENTKNVENYGRVRK